MSSSPEKKKTLTTTEMPSLQSTQNPSLPDDLLLCCFARVPRLYYPTLSLVSKSFRSLLASPVLYQNRSVLGRTETCLYVCLKFPPDPNPRWFTLCRKSDKALINDTGKKQEKKSSGSGNLLAPIQIPHSHKAHWQCVVAAGSSIYAIGQEAPSANISILDCRFHTWREGPSMRVERNRPTANVVDGKIYVAGGCKDRNSSNWMEVFDPKTQAWEPVLCPLAERCISVYKSGVIDGEIYMFGNNVGVAYKPKEDRWKPAIRAIRPNFGLAWFSCCVIGNILYCYSFKNGIQWYDFKTRKWNILKGYVRFQGLPKLSGFLVSLVDYGGKMAVLWDENLPSSSGCQNRRMIWCGVIALEKRNSEEIWGEVEWFDAVLTVPKSYEFEYALSATV